VSADRSKGDQWMRAATRRRGRIEAEPVSREATVGERMSAAVRNAAGRSVRVSPTTDDDAGK
jgi:hypothetical protein